MSIDLRRLRHATVLAAERSFVRAAARLNITQSAVSQSISRLEKEIGLVLFDRRRSGVLVTSAGKEFLKRATTLVLAERGLSHELSLIRESQLGRVACGFTPIPAQIWLRALLPEIVREQPSLEIHVDLATSSHLLEQLLLDRIEFVIAIQANIRPARELAIRPLARVNVGFFVRRDHKLGGRRDLSVKDLKGHAVLSLPIDDLSQPRVRQWLGLPAAAPLPISVTACDSAALKDVALASDAILVLPHALIRKELAAGDLVELPMKGLRHVGSADVCLVSLADSTLSPAAALFISRLEGQIADPRIRKFVTPADLQVRRLT